MKKENLKMKKKLLLYWSPRGNVEKAANLIYEQFDPSEIDMINLEDFSVDDMKKYDGFIFGIATINAHTWREAEPINKWSSFFIEADENDFIGKKFAFYGLGDQLLYPNNFVDALDFLNTEVKKKKGIVIGKWPISGYEFNETNGAKNGFFYGLALDQNQETGKSPERVEKWVKQIKKEF
jgi:flavodoxin I